MPVMSMSEVRSQWRADFERVRAAFEIAHPLQARWEAWFSNDRLWPERTAFTHGELYAAHVLVDGPSRIVGVLDWTTAKVGDPAVDFTYQHMMGPAAFEATVAAYIEAGGVLLPHPPNAARSSPARRWLTACSRCRAGIPSIVQPRRRSFLQRSELGIRNTTWSGHALP